ncbi:MAG: hypothetical protein J5956_13060 [Ruminococcus sp.]|nr:hypothetical protein [Ruminococcus sp.]
MAAVIDNNPAMENTIEMLSLLNETELAAVNAVIKAFVSKSNDNNPFQPLSENQLIERIDKALASAEKGMYKNSDDFEKELLVEFGA